MLQSLGDRADHLIVGQHAAVDRAARHGRGNQGRIIEELQIDLEAVILVEIQRISHIEGAIARPDHRTDLQCLGSLGNRCQSGGTCHADGQECLANATQQCDGHDVQLLHSGKKARDRVVMTVSRAFIPPCSFLIPGSRKTLGPAICVLQTGTLVRLITTPMSVMRHDMH